ncbi:MAG: hypothetical protein R6X15_01940 [Pseudomonadota bacterium]
MDEFLSNHWGYPMAPQGEPPSGFSALEASLAPESCAACHSEQHKQWRESLHSHTMGPGIRWQLQLMNPEASRSCLKCHAPLTEQFALHARERGWSKSKAARPEHVPADLHRKGLACAACHVRRHQRFGPPAKSETVNRTVHGGFTEHKAFGDSRFCATCHQFPEDGSRLNGKLREDTYNQWRQSRFAAEGRSCQSCHMPERRHEWKGIHDPEMTRSALSVQFTSSGEESGTQRVSATVSNSGAGHHFPTYLVPDVQLVLEYLMPSGEVNELARHTLAWRANLALTEEQFDQRLPAGKSVKLQGRLPTSQAEGNLRLRVSVAPKHQYLVTYEDYLARKGDTLDEKTLGLLQLAIQEARSSQYDFVAAEQSLGLIAK